MLGLRLLLMTLATVTVPAASAAKVPVLVTGNPGADGELLQDIMQNVVNFGGVFDCPAPSRIKVMALEPSLFPKRSPHHIDSDMAAYEEWDASFCGKVERFFIRYAPDPNGGTMISIGYPYPDDAPRGKPL